MRRDPTADNGLVELMVTALAENAAAFGVGRVSLNFAMFREAFERGAQIGAGPLARLWRQGLLLASRTWQLESLYRSNAKYLPTWQPRFMCFEYTSDLPRVGDGRRQRRGLLDPAVAGDAARQGGDARRSTPATRSTRPRYAALIPPAPDPVAEAHVDRAGSPSRCAYGARSWTACGPKGIDPYPGHVPAHPHAGRGVAEAGTLPPDTYDRPAGLGRRAASSSSATRASSASPSCATAAATSR